MKKVLMLLALLGSPVMADQVSKSSFTLTNETAYIAARNLHRIMVGASSAGGSITVFNSTWTTSSPIISSMTLSVGNYMEFQNLNVAGIIYKTISNVNGVTIIYTK